jgi:hypothetical protein
MMAIKQNSSLQFKLTLPQEMVDRIEREKRGALSRNEAIRRVLEAGLETRVKIRRSSIDRHRGRGA